MFNATRRVVRRKIVGKHDAQELQPDRVVLAIRVVSRVVTKYQTAREGKKAKNTHNPDGEGILQRNPEYRNTWILTNELI